MDRHAFAAEAFAPLAAGALNMQAIPADPVLSAEEMDRLWFELGWDCACAGLPIPHSPSDQAAKGWHEARRRVPRKLATRFDRKWLLLRTNAARRGRLVDPAVTPVFLEAITPELCPVIAETMSSGANNPLAASIDRVCNKGAYAIGNIAAMSVMANSAKGARRFGEVAQIAARLWRDGGLECGLNGRHWARLAALMIGPEAVATGRGIAFPQCTVIPNGLVVTLPQVMQEAILFDVVLGLDRTRANIARPMRAAGSEKDFKRLLQAIRHKLGRTNWLPDVWLEAGVFQRFLVWWNTVGDGGVAELSRAVYARPGEWRFAVDCDAAHARWGIPSGGYLT